MFELGGCQPDPALGSLAEMNGFIVFHWAKMSYRGTQ